MGRLRNEDRVVGRQCAERRWLSTRSRRLAPRGAHGGRNGLRSGCSTSASNIEVSFHRRHYLLLFMVEVSSRILRHAAGGPWRDCGHIAKHRVRGAVWPPPQWKNSGAGKQFFGRELSTRAISVFIRTRFDWRKIRHHNAHLRHVAAWAGGDVDVLLDSAGANAMHILCC